MINSSNLINRIPENDNNNFVQLNKLILFTFPQDSHPAEQSHNSPKGFIRVILVSPGCKKIISQLLPLFKLLRKKPLDSEEILLQTN